jgi:hypothetical protein
VHNYVIGATRSGKTNYLLSQIGGAFAFIDKHGQAAQQIADLPDLPLGRARMRTLFRGQPTSAMLTETEKVTLPTGRLEANIRHTRASYSRPRRVVEEMMRGRPKTKHRPWKGGW